MRKFAILGGLLCLAACNNTRPAKMVLADNQNLLAVSQHTIQTKTPLKMTFSSNDQFKVSGPDTRMDFFNETPFRVSRAAFINEASAIMVHAETVEDGSGASNYDNLPVSDWPKTGFRSNGEICMTLGADDIKGEPDPEWLIDQGFDPLGSLVFGQYFLTTADHNHEVVVSVMLKVSDCDEDDNSSRYAALQSKLRVSEDVADRELETDRWSAFSAATLAQIYDLTYRL